MCHNFNPDSKAAVISDVISRLYTPTWGEFGELTINYDTQHDNWISYTCIAFQQNNRVQFNKVPLYEEWQQFANASPDIDCNVGFRDVRRPYGWNSEITYRVSDPEVLFFPRMERLYLFHQANFCMDGVP